MITKNYDADENDDAILPHLLVSSAKVLQDSLWITSTDIVLTVVNNSINAMQHGKQLPCATQTT